jgi:3-oxoacyl-[acyl-carrier-protein] synthase-3
MHWVVFSCMKEDLLGVVINGIGKAVPKLVLHNTDLEKFIETDNNWIIERTGIEERRVSEGEKALDLAAEAAREALGSMDYDSIDLVIVATVTPDMLVPSMGAMVKKELKLNNAIAFDINTACSGFLYATWMAEALIKNGASPNSNTNAIHRALVVGVERLSRIVDWTDRGTCILFGDGAGAAVLELDPAKEGIISSFMKNYDDDNDSLICGMEYLKTPFTQDEEIRQVLKMHGTRVFKFAVNAVGEVMDEALKKANLTADQIDHYIPHQANMRIISSAAQRFNQPLEKFQVSIDKTGNVSAASVPMAMHDIYATGKVKPGDLVMLVGFGGGLSAGAVIYRA